MMLKENFSDFVCDTNPLGLRSPPPPPTGGGVPWQRSMDSVIRVRLLQRTTGKSHTGQLAPMALCDIHVCWLW